MPFKDSEKRRAYDRDRRRIKRVAPTLSPTLLELPAEYREAKATDILAILAEQLVLLREDEDLGTVERARTIASVSSVALKALESANLTGRLEELERILKRRDQ